MDKDGGGDLHDRAGTFASNYIYAQIKFYTWIIPTVFFNQVDVQDFVDSYAVCSSKTVAID